MKYPLTMTHRALRELKCFFVGHRWKHATRIHTQYFGMHRENVPYNYRKRSKGNCMWEYVSSWEVKCKSCRTKVYDFRRLPRETWHLRWIHYLKQVWWQVSIWWEVAFELAKENRNNNGWKYYVSLPYTLILEALSGFFISRHFDGDGMYWLAEIWYELKHKVHKWQEK